MFVISVPVCITFVCYQSLASSSLSITPSINTKAVHLVFRVDDSLGSGLCKVMVDLKYDSHSYLPQETIFNFVGKDH